MNDESNPGAPSAPPRATLFGRRTQLRSPSESLQPQSAPPPPPPQLRKRRREGLSRISGVLSFLLIAAVVAIGGFAFAMLEARKPGPLPADKIVVLTREDDGGPIPDQLERAGVIESPLWFDLVLTLDGNRGALKRGEYLFKQAVSLREVEDLLVSHKVLLHKVTVPEGLTSDQVVQRLRENDVLRRRHQGDCRARVRCCPRPTNSSAAICAPSVLATMEWPRPRRSTKSGRSARPICRSSRRANW